jgi:valyl-tRNA synthetase
MTELPKAYTPRDVEGAIYERWLAADVFAPDGAGSTADPALPPFTIIQPPPNVTGSLHLGHAQRTTVEDLMIRHARMRGHAALFLPGLDHASIAAQFVLDGILAKEGESRQSLGRERYLERMVAFSDSTKPVILGQQRRVGASADWGRLRYTMDEGSARAVRVAFDRLYRDGLAYRTEALVNWCPGCRTSVSDLEVIPTEEAGTLWSVRYHLIDPATGEPSPTDTITVATTRPETILGDTAVAVHPDDERFAALVGRLVRIPFVERDVPIIADDVVQRDFGSGAVKITPAHDHDDHATGKRHGLPAPTILADDASVTGTDTPYDGLDRFEARHRIVADLAARGDLVGERPHEMVVGRCQRSEDILEPRLKTQWFIRMDGLAARALDATRSGRTRILPERFEKTWEHWLTDIRDWNVSRQLWWGHRIPAWYCPDGHISVSAAAGGPDACEVCARPGLELQQDPDIFDTWFSSGLWPFSTLGWPDDTPDLDRFYPTSVMETGYDIIFFWVARMVMLGLHLTDQEPFHTIYLSGLIRDPQGKKMSKTKGNVLDPLAVIDETGADALRFALIHGAAAGQDQRFGPVKLENARNFANKLWNATRFVVGRRPATIPADAERRLPDARHLGPAERWLLSRAAATVEAVDGAMAGYQFGEMTRTLYDAIWSEFCDWGVELAKVRLADDTLDAAVHEATWWTLVEVLDTYLRLLHPVMPFVTEALWAAIPHRPADPDLLIVARWPGVGERDPEAEREVASVLDLISGLRNARSEARLEPGVWLPVEIAVPASIGPTFEALRPAIARLARVRPVDRRLTREALTDAPGDLTVLAGELEARLRSAPTGEGTANADAVGLEQARLQKELAEAESRLAAVRGRLADPGFIGKAPPQVVDGARSSEAELADQVERLRSRLGG